MKKFMRRQYIKGAAPGLSLIGLYVSMEEGADVVDSVVRDSILFSHARVENVM